MPNPTQPPRGDIGPKHSYASDRAALSRQQVERAADWMARQQPRPLQFDARDLADALPDAFAIRAGQKPRGPVHPMADWASELSFSRLCEQLQIRSLNSSDFGAALSVGYRQIVETTYSETDDCGGVFLDSVVGNFQETVFPVIDTVDLEKVSATGISNVPLQVLDIGAGEARGRVRSYRARVLVSRQLLLSDDFALISSLLQHLSGHAARLPGQQLGQILTSNPTLADGDPLIHDNVTNTVGYGMTALAEAASKLRLVRSATNNKMNLTPRIWICPPDGEFLAKQTLRLADPSGIAIIVNPWIESGYSFLLASPQQQPVFVRLLLSSPLRPAVTTAPCPPSYDGILLDMSTDFGISVVSRLGIVGIPTSA